MSFSDSRWSASSASIAAATRGSTAPTDCSAARKAVVSMLLMVLLRAKIAAAIQLRRPLASRRACGPAWSGLTGRTTIIPGDRDLAGNEGRVLKLEEPE